MDCWETRCSNSTASHVRIGSEPSTGFVNLTSQDDVSTISSILFKSPDDLDNGAVQSKVGLLMIGPSDSESLYICTLYPTFYNLLIQPPPSSLLEYSVKIMNPMKRSDFTIYRWKCPDIFSSLEECHRRLSQEFDKEISKYGPNIGLQVGYIEIGHGWKGRQRWLVSNDDITEMYKIYEGKKEILLWCIGKRKDGPNAKEKKRALSEPDTSDERPKTKFSKHDEQMVKVDEIFKKLKTIHSSAYSSEQLHTWAHMINLEKHDSYTDPPDKPFFKTKKLKTVVATHDGVSPSKRISLRSECITQLQKWHSLYESGGISEEDYRQLQLAILSDIKDM